MSVTNLFYSLSVYGMRTFQVADTNNKYCQGTYVFSRKVTGMLSLALCIIFVAVNGYGWENSLGIIFYMLFRTGEAMFDVYTGIYQKHWRMDYMGKSMILRGVLMVILFSISLWATGSLPLSFLMMALCTAVFLRIYDLKRVKAIVDIRFEKRYGQLKQLLIECFPLVIYLFLNAAVTSVPRYMLERMEGQSALGVYAAIAAPTLVVQMISTYIFNPFVTAFAERYHRGDKQGFWKLFKTCLSAIAVVSAVAMAGSLLVGKSCLRILYGKEIVEYAYLLLPLVLCTVLTAFSWLLCGMLTVVRDFKGLIGSNLLAVLAGIGAALILIRKYSIQGTSFAVIISLIVEILLCLVFLKRKLKAGFGKRKDLSGNNLS